VFSQDLDKLELREAEFIDNLRHHEVIHTNVGVKRARGELNAARLPTEGRVVNRDEAARVLALEDALGIANIICFYVL